MTTPPQPAAATSTTMNPSAVKPSKTKSPPANPIIGVGYRMGHPLLALTISVSVTAAFYLMVFLLTATEITSVIGDPLRRYFLGHPIAVAATIMFWFAIGLLAAKHIAVMAETRLLRRLFDHHLAPVATNDSPANQWLSENDAGHVAKQWLSNLAALSQATRASHLVRRLEEILVRQSHRGSSKQLSDDLREVSMRDGDAAHDSLGMVRIIVWAIPMLGFLGTVIGITQTLGGLDFSNGSAAVDNLKSGLYVAFDTTAVGLVLSVLAIFLQFPIERSEQRLLAEIDARVGSLATSHLPSDEASDNQTVLVADLCRGVQAAISESLDNQAKLWQGTIEAAQNQWQSVHDGNNEQLVNAFKVSLVPALVQHSEVLSRSQERFEAMGNIEQTLSENLQSLRQTSESIDRHLAAKESMESETDQTMADAVCTLARAVDILSAHMASGPTSTSAQASAMPATATDHTHRRAA